MLIYLCLHVYPAASISCPHNEPGGLCGELCGNIRKCLKKEVDGPTCFGSTDMILSLDSRAFRHYSTLVPLTPTLTLTLAKLSSSACLLLSTWTMTSPRWLRQTTCLMGRDMECKFCHKAFTKGEHLRVSDIRRDSSSSVANQMHRDTNEAVR